MAKTFPTTYGLSLIRVGVGMYFVTEAYNKTSKHWLTDGGPLTRMLRQGLPRVAPFYRHFLEGTVLPHAALFARLVTLGEWTAGICLILGLLTPVGAAVGIWLNLNYMLLKGLPNTSGNVDRLFVLSEVIFIATSAGLVLGLDGILWRILTRLRSRQASTPPVAPRPLREKPRIITPSGGRRRP